MEHAGVRVGMGIALPAQNFLDTVVAPTRPGVRGEHILGLLHEEMARLVDPLRPFEWVTHKRPTKRVDLVGQNFIPKVGDGMR